MKILDVKRMLDAAVGAGFGDDEMMVNVYLKGEDVRVRVSSGTFISFMSDDMKFRVSGSVEES